MKLGALVYIRAVRGHCCNSLEVGIGICCLGTTASAAHTLSMFQNRKHNSEIGTIHWIHNVGLEDCN